jgi:hypothetical protein
MRWSAGRRARAGGWFAIALVMTLVGGAAAQALMPAPYVRVYVDGRLASLDVPPVIAAGRVLVPLRGVFEQTGAIVAWDGGTQTVLAQRGNTSVALQIGSAQATVNGVARILDTPPVLVGGRTMIPLRFVSEALGVRVDWDAATTTVTISQASALPPSVRYGPSASVPPPQPRPTAVTPPPQIVEVMVPPPVVEVAAAPPPPPRREPLPPPRPGFIWIAGHWRYAGGWVWTSGWWDAVPFPGAVWVSSRWEHRSAGWTWIGGSWRGYAVTQSPPPPPRVEVIGRPSVPDAVWIKGDWRWDARQWLWTPGRWQRAPWRTAHWVPGYWTRRTVGWVRVAGYWR